MVKEKGGGENKTMIRMPPSMHERTVFDDSDTLTGLQRANEHLKRHPDCMAVTLARSELLGIVVRYLELPALASTRFPFT